MDELGTTTMAVRILNDKGDCSGIVFASDTRSVTKKTVEGVVIKDVCRQDNIKIFQFADNVYGAAAGTISVIDHIKYSVHNSIKKRDELGMITTVKDVACIISWMLSYEESVNNQFTVGGRDVKDGWQIYNVLPFQKIKKHDVLFGGSGRNIAADFYKREMKSRAPKTHAHAIKIARDIMACVFKEDDSSGGSVHILAVMENETIDRIFCRNRTVLDRGLQV